MMLRNRLSKTFLRTESVESDDEEQKGSERKKLLNESLPIREELKTLRKNIDSVKTSLEKDIQALMLSMDIGVLKNFLSVSESIQNLQEQWLSLCTSEIKTKIIFNELTYLNTEFFYVFEYYKKAYDIVEKYCTRIQHEAHNLSKDLEDKDVKECESEKESESVSENVEADQKAQEELDEMTQRASILMDIEQSLGKVRDKFLKISICVKDNKFSVKGLEYKTDDTVRQIDKSINKLMHERLYPDKVEKNLKFICVGLLIAVVFIYLMVKN
ncbi:syntaxin-19-like [Chironomus tepperi]|uniref:syntaxin-19-like n=1 Tax=Chironomus tepperi TaxID=113505 RepID=UPI00391F8458